MITPASMPHHRPNQHEPVFVDQTTGETGIMLQRADAVFCFHPHTGGPPRPILQPGQYRSAEPATADTRRGQPRRRRAGRRGGRPGSARQ